MQTPSKIQEEGVPGLFLTQPLCSSGGSKNRKLEEVSLLAEKLKKLSSTVEIKAQKKSISQFLQV